MTRTLAPIVFGMLVFLRGSEVEAQQLEPPPPIPPGEQGSPPASTVTIVSQPQAASPGPSTPVTTQTSVVQEQEDSGLGLEWVWFNADVGGAYVSMDSLSTSSFGLKNTTSFGPAFGVAAGVRLLFLTLGVRARDMLLPSIGSLWELNAEAALHTRIGHVDPYLGARGGYDFVGSLSSDSIQVAGGASPPDVTVHGFNVGPMVGVDVYFSKLVSIGVDGDLQFLFLQRPPVARPKGAPVLADYYYSQTGSSVGYGVTVAAHLGIHF